MDIRSYRHHDSPSRTMIECFGCRRICELEDSPLCYCSSCWSALQAGPDGAAFSEWLRRLQTDTAWRRFWDLCGSVGAASRSVVGHDVDRSSAALRIVKGVVGIFVMLLHPTAH